MTLMDSAEELDDVVEEEGDDEARLGGVIKFCIVCDHSEEVTTETASPWSSSLSSRSSFSNSWRRWSIDVFSVSWVAVTLP